MKTSLIVVAILGLLCGPGSVFGQLEVFTVGGSCTFEGQSYSNGATICQEGVRQRCNDGSWEEEGAPCGDEMVVEPEVGIVEPVERPIEQAAPPLEPVAPLR